MIFKKLFRSKHQNPDPQVRILAIDNLNKQDPEQKSVLHELAFNDSDVNVSLAALHKLDSFALWYKMSEIAKNERVLKRSRQEVENALLGNNSEQLDDVERRKFVLECRDNRLLEKLITQVWVQQDTDLAMQVLQKLDKPQVQEKLLFGSQNIPLQISIVEALKDTPQQRKLLNKVLKKSAQEDLIQAADKQLSSWMHDEQVPLEIEQHVKMVLSKLLALKDKNDLLDIQAQQKQLVERYNELAEGFHHLSDGRQIEVKDKFQDIQRRIEVTVKQLKPSWEAKEKEQAISRAIDLVATSIEHTLEHFSEQLATRISEIEPNEIATFNNELSEQVVELNKLSGQLNADNKVEHRRVEKLNNRVLSSINTSKNIPDFQQALKTGQMLLAKFVDLPLPDDLSQIDAAEEYIRELKHQWRDAVSRYLSHVPSELTEEWNKQITHWQLAIQGLKKQANADLARCRNKLRTIDSLVQQGKFKSAMGLYQKVSGWYADLTDKQQKQLEKPFATTKEKIENLKDWQDYIAAPRKPALLSEVQALVETPLSVDAQASAIKSLRSQWNSLGKTDSEADQALNLAFEDAIEKAFLPCRAFYDQQRKEREQNLVAKQNVLEEIHALGESEMNLSELSKNLRSLQQKWKNIGEVDFKVRSEMYERYQKLVKPLVDNVEKFYLDNAEQKKRLLDRATKLIEIEPISEAIDQAKRIQESWKAIEHAGKAETELWPAFRKINDALFAKRAEISRQQKAATKQQIEEVDSKVKELEEAVSSAGSQSLLKSAMEQKQAIADLVAELTMPNRRTYENKLHALEDIKKQRMKEFEHDAKRLQYQQLFLALKNWHTSGDLPDEVNGLPKSWHSCFQTINESIDRQELTIKMEIIAEKESPDIDLIKRKEIQMQLMASKLQSGEGVQLNGLLKEWIKAGALVESESELLSRIEVLFLP